MEKPSLVFMKTLFPGLPRSRWSLAMTNTHHARHCEKQSDEAIQQHKEHRAEALL